MGKVAPRMAAVGLAIGLGAAATLVWNEWRLARSLDAVALARRSLAAGGGQVVAVTGEARATQPARDPLFGVAVNALRLDRTAETYQWREHREGSGDNKVLRYERVWSPVLIPSQRFEQRLGHANPPRLAIASASFLGGEVRLGERVLAEVLVERLPAVREIWPDRPVSAAGLRFARSGDWLYSGDPAAAAIGDVRVRFAAAPPGLVTVVAAEQDGRLAPSTGAGETVGLAAYGEVPAEELLIAAARGDWRNAWALRGFAGLVLVVAALFVQPALEQRRFGRGGRLTTILLLAAGAWAVACAAGWLGARLLLGLGIA